jgi:hypothetical protein
LDEEKRVRHDAALSARLTPRGARICDSIVVELRRAFVIVEGELIELHPKVWRTAKSDRPRETITAWQGRGPLRQYPYRLPNGELIALYSEQARDVVDAIASGVLDRLI